MRVQPTHQPFSTAIVLVTLALSAHLLARGVTSLAVARILRPPLHMISHTWGPTSARTPGFDPPDVRAILARNIFDFTTGPLPKPPAAPQLKPTPVAAPKPGESAPRCDDSLRLIASVYSERAPESSLASIQIGNEPPLIYRERSWLQDKETVAITPDAVYMSSRGALCSLTLFEHTQGAAASLATSPRPKPTKRSGVITDAELEASIRRASETKLAVARSFIDRVLQDPAELMRLARVVPHQENGQVIGVQIFGVRSHGLLSKLGLQNGDVLRSINGYALASPDSALAAYAALRTATNLSLAITRHGRELTIEYAIADGI